MATFVTLTLDPADIIGADFDPRRASAWLETNTGHGVIVVDGSTFRLGGRREAPAADGTITFANLVATNSASNPASFSYRVRLIYVPKGSRKQGHDEWVSGWFPLTATSNLAAIPEAWGDLADPGPEWRSELRDEMEAALAEAQAISGLTGEDDAVALLMSTPGSGTATALSAKITAAVAAEDVPGQVADALVPEYRFLISGTSQAVGTGTSDPPNTSYPSFTKQVIDPSLGVTTVLANGGESGKQSDDLLASLPGKIAANRPNVVVLELPINDVRVGDALTLDQTIQNMARQASLARLAGAEPVFMTGVPISPAYAALFGGLDASFPDTAHISFAQRVAALRAKGAEMGIKVADTWNLIRHANVLPVDGLHYGDTITGKVASVLSSVLMNQTPAEQWTLAFAYTFGTIGAEWTPVGGTWSVDTGKAKNDTGGSGALLLTETGGVGQGLTVDLSWASGSPDGSIVIRSDGTANTGYVAGLFPSGGNTDLRLYKLGGGGALTLIKQVASVPVTGNACQITITAAWEIVTVWLDGLPYISAQDGTHATGTKAGLRQGGNTALRFDNATMRR